MTALVGIPLISPGDDLAEILVAALSASGIELLAGDVLALASKIVSKAEGRFVKLADVVPSARAVEVAARCRKDPRLVHLILEESEGISRMRPGLLIVRHRLGFVCANAGIDRSNVGPGDPDEETVLLLPLDPDGSAANLRRRIREATGVGVGIVLADSHGRPHRLGAVGVAVGAAGLPALEDCRGRPDLFGRPLQHTTIGLADQVASAASLLFGQAGEGAPAVHLRGIPYESRPGSAADLVRSPELDLFR